ncbi:hypothetical protein [Umezawaea sp. Da 62-37]|uniref:hypothetical protein n=1 Tax=Umezawaea sp. Da 62-37 TaxID=3075927 RepID=UPI0028F6FA1B|nr:hypothetical protein [Umezawaea sp. Da 62-37]WNV83475.1 hypothetical protein RM788_35595 [Umezawaea sp. Da 62-37]
MDIRIFSVAVIESFSSFVTESSLEELSPSDHACLADYIYTWLMRGGGAEVCQREFLLLQIANQVIADYWHHYKTALDYSPTRYGGAVHVARRTEDLFPSGYGVSHPILDPNIFA